MLMLETTPLTLEQDLSFFVNAHSKKEYFIKFTRSDYICDTVATPFQFILISARFSLMT